MSSRFFRRRQKFLLTIAAAALSTLVVFKVFPHIITDIGYLSRPIWDKTQTHFGTVLVHHYAEGMSMKQRCEAHGWTLLPETTPKPKVYDAVIFSVELDMLEIRLKELYDVVDTFVIIEANASFTGIPKELHFELNKERFAFAASKIVYRSIPLFKLEAHENPWWNENRMRAGMTQFLTEIGIQPGDLVTSADVDELISAHTIDLLKSCQGVPESLHLQLRNYLYSYEFYVDDGIWQTSIHHWNPGNTRYVHSKTSDVLLSDSGWHCSFCFRMISDFQFKMKGYSHTDRIRSSKMVTPEWIQKTICAGGDLFGMFIEAYTFRDLFRNLGHIPSSQSAVGLPAHVLANREKFGFLLPGGCQREDGPPPS